MPYDTAEIEAPARPVTKDDAPTAAEALANPEATLAFLYLSPRPCAALDALLSA